MQPNYLRVLWIEDDAEFAEAISQELQRELRLDVVASSRLDGMVLGTVEHDALVFGAVPEQTRLELFMRAREQRSSLPVLVFAEQDELETFAATLPARGADDFLVRRRCAEVARELLWRIVLATKWQSA